jgi:hypothetical protein
MFFSPYILFLYSLYILFFSVVFSSFLAVYPNAVTSIPHIYKQYINPCVVPQRTNVHIHKCTYTSATERRVD